MYLLLVFDPLSFEEGIDQYRQGYLKFEIDYKVFMHFNLGTGLLTG